MAPKHEEGGLHTGDSAAAGSFPTKLPGPLPAGSSPLARREVSTMPDGSWVFGGRTAGAAVAVAAIILAVLVASILATTFWN